MTFNKARCWVLQIFHNSMRCWGMSLESGPAVKDQECWSGVAAHEPACAEVAKKARGILAYISSSVTSRITSVTVPKYSE